MGAMNQFKTVVLLGLLTGLLLAVGWYFGGSNGLAIALIFSILMNFGSYYFSDKIVLMMYRAQEVKEADYPDLYRIVREVSQLAMIPMPKVYLMTTATPNAFATGRNPEHSAVACTTGILNLLSKDELRGVIAHEMSHIKNRDILITTIAATIAGVISYAAMMVRWGAIFGGLGNRDRDSSDVFYMLALAILTPIIAMLLQLALSRSREYLADETGAKTIHNSHALANALEKLDDGIKRHPLRFGSPATSSLFILNPFSASGIMTLLSTHPPLKERIKRLKAMRA